MKENVPSKRPEKVIKVEVDESKVRKPLDKTRAAVFDDKRLKRKRTRNNIKVEDQKENLNG